MTTFSARNVSEAYLPVAPDEVWDVISNPGCLAQLTPLIDRIEDDGDTWCWRLRGISGLGITVEPSFRERMTFHPKQRLDFEPAPRAGESHVLGADGVYEIARAADGRTRLAIDITLIADLPLPRLSRRAVEAVMARSMKATGDRFAGNLYGHVGIDPADAEIRILEGTTTS